MKILIWFTHHLNRNLISKQKYLFTFLWFYFLCELEKSDYWLPTILFHRQLIRNGQLPDYKKTFDDINHKIDLAILPLWKFEVNLSKEAAFILFEMIRDIFYSRMNPKNMSADTIRSVVNEAKQLLSQMKKEGKFN